MPEIITLKLLFLVGFTLHNLEEALWLPGWSANAGKWQRPLDRNSFIFALIIITLLGYLITLADILDGQTGNFIHYLFLGFAGMMGLNAVFPHLAATLLLKKYAPGLLTGLLLNLPLSLILIIHSLQNGARLSILLPAVILVSGLVLFSLKYLFRFGGKISAVFSREGDPG
ncbi:MAG: HXXEE domain-containing protein [Calditrichia bacterium]